MFPQITSLETKTKRTSKTLNGILQIGKNIKALRLKKNFKQQAVADAIGLSLTAYCNIECGKTESITLHRLLQIADVLDADITSILSGQLNNNSHLVIMLQNELEQTKEQLQKANKKIELLQGREKTG